MGYPSIYNDKVAIKTCLQYGFSQQDANEYITSGCEEIGRQAGGPGDLVSLSTLVLRLIWHLQMDGNVRRHLEKEPDSSYLFRQVIRVLLKHMKSSKMQSKHMCRADAPDLSVCTVLRGSL